MNKTYRCNYRYSSYNYRTQSTETRESFTLINAKGKKQATEWFDLHLGLEKTLINVALATKMDIRSYHWPIDDANDPVLELIERICREKMPSIEERGGLDSRWNDTDDFPEVSIACMKEAMIAIYHAGIEYGRKYGQNEITCNFSDDPA